MRSDGTEVDSELPLPRSEWFKHRKEVGRRGGGSEAVLYAIDRDVKPLVNVTSTLEANERKSEGKSVEPLTQSDKRP